MFGMLAIANEKQFTAMTRTDKLCRCAPASGAGTGMLFFFLDSRKQKRTSKKKKNRMFFFLVDQKKENGTLLPL